MSSAYRTRNQKVKVNEDDFAEVKSIIKSIDSELEEILNKCETRPDEAFSDLLMAVNKINYLSSMSTTTAFMGPLKSVWNKIKSKYPTWVQKIVDILSKLKNAIKPSSYTLTIGYPFGISISVTW